MMDRSFLSQTEVVEASRSFVCIRLLTYENAEEARMLSQLVRTGSGQLENTVFALLAPDGKTLLARPGRSCDWAFRDAHDMASGMKQLAAYYGPGRAAGKALPEAENVRLALNLAACENQPLVIGYARDPATQAQLQATMARLAWDSQWQGQAVYVRTRQPGDLKAISGSVEEGLLVVQPDPFGLTGTVLRRLDPQATAAQLAKAVSLYRPVAKDTPRHVYEGHQRGVHWQTAIPVTDPEGRY